MRPDWKRRIPGALILFLLLGVCSSSVWAGGSAGIEMPFPTALDSYQDSGLERINAQLLHRIRLKPFNLVATLIFLCAIVHTFMASKFMAMSHARGQAHQPLSSGGLVCRR